MILSELLTANNIQAILSSISDGVVIVDNDRRIQFVNEQAAALLGYQVQDMQGRTCKTILQSTDCDNNCPFTRILKAGDDQTEVEMVYYNHNDQPMRTMTRFQLLKDNTGAVIGSAEIFKDLTDLKKLEEQLRGKYSYANIIGKNHKMQEVYDLINEVAATSTNVIIYGESGTGKELVANAIHEHSRRKAKPFVRVNCSALAEGILESELFGHVRGAFTGALYDKKGRFESADGGTVFLDEIGEIPASTQVKLLNVLQKGEFEKVGSSKTIQVDVRIVAATNRNLLAAVQEGLFREDLYYRLNVVPIQLPPLRDRRDDIPLLVTHFIQKFNQSMPDKFINTISSNAKAVLLDYQYPGNVRELENIIEHAFVRCQTDTIVPRHLPQHILSASSAILKKAMQSETPIKDMEREMIVLALNENNGKITQAAKQLGISRVTLWRRLKQLQLETVT